jgi:DNA (cytosine-5)-methyltransferase 1
MPSPDSICSTPGNAEARDPVAVLDLFSAAAGGWSLGMHRAGFRTVAACEVVDWRRAMYAANNPGVRLYDDVRTLTADRLRRDLGSFPSVVVGSPPCQDISGANTKGKGVDGEHSGLFFEAIRIIGEGRPRWIALENSDRVRTRGYDRIAAALEAKRYDLWPLVVGTGNAGASHKRKRAWIIGMDADAPSSQGWLAGQPWLDADPHRPNGALSGADWRGWRGSEEARRGTCNSMGADADGEQLRVERGARAGRQALGKEAVIAGLARVFRGPVGSSDLSGHIRAYAGVSACLAEQCREAYGDAVSPQITEAIGRAIIRVERALSAIYGDTTPAPAQQAPSLASAEGSPEAAQVERERSREEPQ